MMVVGVGDLFQLCDIEKAGKIVKVEHRVVTAVFAKERLRPHQGTYPSNDRR